MEKPSLSVDGETFDPLGLRIRPVHLALQLWPFLLEGILRTVRFQTLVSGTVIAR